MDIYTIGHSTHTKEELIKILKKYKIEILVDVRSYPGSKYVPQFNKENMKQWIHNSDISYIHMSELGGRKNEIKNIDESLINGWENLSFRNYAGYSLTKEYEEAIKKLITLAEKNNVYYMYPESVP